MSSYIEGSIPWEQLKPWATEIMRMYQIEIPLQPRLRKSWRKKVGRELYPELWLRYYAALRQFHSCMVLASDWANHMTETNMPIVQDKQLDLKLLLANAQVQKKSGYVRSCKHWGGRTS